MLTIGRSALESLAALLLERAGLRISADGFHGLRLALQERMPALGISDADDYVRRLRDRQGEHELRALLPLVTVTHTEFFRDPRQFRALERRVLPEALSRARRQGRQISVWSAGCATGEEPYSIAMVLSDLGAARTEVNLWATDLNQAAVENARQGRYPNRRLAPVQAERAKRYFTQTEDGYEVVPELREWIRFEGHNLAAPVFAKVQPDSFDVILCRNVIIYFDLPTIRALMDRFYAALRPGAFLVLGYSESLFRVYDRFEMVEVEGAFLYRRPRLENVPRKRPMPIERERPTPPSVPALPASPRPAFVPRTTGEFPIVVPAKTSAPATTPPAASSSSPQRLQVTGEFPVVVPANSSHSPEATRATQGATSTRRAPADRLTDAAKLVAIGRFDQALEALKSLRADEPEDLATELTLGNVYSVMGKAEEAKALFQDVSAREPLCVEARLYGAMAAMQVSRFADARSELSKATFLEPALAIAHYLAAQVHERLGERDAARRAYRNAIAQLQYPQRQLAGHYPDFPETPDVILRAAKYALSALEEEPAPAA